MVCFICVTLLHYNSRFKIISCVIFFFRLVIFFGTITTNQTISSFNTTPSRVLKKENGIQSSAFLSILNFIAIFWWIEVHLGLGGLRGPLLGLGCLGFSQAKGTTTCQEIENGLAGPDSKHNQSLTFHSLHSLQ